MLASQQTINELTDVLYRPKFDKYISSTVRNQFLTAFLQEVLLVEVTICVTDCRDSKDNKFLELALSQTTSAIISGDMDLLILHPYKGIKILTPESFIEQL
jgi:putative PIN family toxin of toxin-antitoxin system